MSVSSTSGWPLLHMCLTVGQSGGSVFFRAEGYLSKSVFVLCVSIRTHRLAFLYIRGSGGAHNKPVHSLHRRLLFHRRDRGGFLKRLVMPLALSLLRQLERLEADSALCSRARVSRLVNMFAFASSKIYVIEVLLGPLEHPMSMLQGL